MEEKDSTPTKTELDRQLVDRTRVIARSFRARRETVYPGKLLVIRSGCFLFQAVDDNTFDPTKEHIQGIAFWGAQTERKQGTVRVENGSEGDYVPLIGSDDQRPPSGVPLIDAWVARADVLRCLMRGRAVSIGSLSLTPVEMLASAEEVTRVVRETAMELLKIAPRDQRDSLRSLARVVDAAIPDDECLTGAIYELLAASASWTDAQPDAPRANSNETGWRDVQHRLLELYNRGGVFPKYRDLANALGCSVATIRKAIKPPQAALDRLDEPDRMDAVSIAHKLAGWQARYSKQKGSPRARSLTEALIGDAEQTRERNPAEAVDMDEVDTVLARLVQDGNPEERAKLNEMTSEERRQLVALLRNDPDKYNRILGRTP